MRFLYPHLLPFALLALVPIVLYLFRRKPRTVRVSTLIFYKSLAREHQESEWLRRLKRLLSLLLNLMIILWAVGALARPVVAPSAGALKSVVLLLDRSASMAARGSDGQTRLEVAIERLRRRLAGLPSGVGVMVMAYDQRPEILLPFSLERRAVERALAALQPRPIEGHPAAALRLAKRMAQLDAPASVWHATDRPLEAKAGAPGHSLAKAPQAASEAADVTVEHLCVGLQEPANVGITAFELRRLPLAASRFEAFVQVHGAAARSLEAELEVRLDGSLTALRKLALEPGRRARLLLPVAAGQGSALSLKVSAPGDVLPLDDEVHARIPQLRPVKVMWVSPSPDPFTELALASLVQDGELEVYPTRPSGWPPKELPDVALFDGWVPKAWPHGPAVIAIDPPQDSGPLQAVRIRGDGLPVEAVRATDQRHPLLYGVATGRVMVTQTAALATDGPLEPLWVGPSGPLLAAGEVSGQRIVVLAFDPERCEHLPLLASYPLLIGNAIYWAAEPRLELRGGNNRKTGELVALAGKSITWSAPAPGNTRKSTVRLNGRWTELDRIGLWESDAGERGSAALLSTRETSLVAVAHPGDDSNPGPSSGGSSLLRGDLTKLCLWAVLIVLLLEAWLFHRHAVY